VVDFLQSSFHLSKDAKIKSAKMYTVYAIGINAIVSIQVKEKGTQRKQVKYYQRVLIDLQRTKLSLGHMI
jgi:hypothetical protein